MAGLADYAELYERMGASSASGTPPARPPLYTSINEDPVTRAAKLRALGATPPPAAAPAANPLVSAAKNPLARGLMRFLGPAAGAVALGAGVYDAATGGGVKVFDTEGSSPTAARAGNAALTVADTVFPGAVTGAQSVVRGLQNLVAPTADTQVAKTLGTGVNDSPVITPAPIGGDAAVPSAPVVSAAPVQPDYRSTVPYTPITRTVSEDGTINITGSGQSPDYLNRNGFGAVGNTPVGRFFGAGMMLKNIAGDNAVRAAAAKAAQDGAAKSAQSTKDLAEAARAGFGVRAAIEHIKVKPGDFAGAAAIAGLRSPAAGGVLVPGELQPLPTAGGPTAAVVVDRSTGAARRVPIAQQGSIAKGTDGKFYVLDAQGKATRAATAEEIARMN